MALLSLPAAAETLYLTAGKFVDPVTAETVNRPAFVIEDGVITARGTTNRLRKPAEATSIDLGDATLVPGFIDMHTHLTSDPEDPAYYSLSFSDERQVLTGVKNARKTLLAGFTTVRNVGASSYGDVALRDAINEGDISGPRMFVSGPPVGILGGHCSDTNLLPSEYELTGENVATGPWEMREKVRRNIKSVSYTHLTLPTNREV